MNALWVKTPTIGITILGNGFYFAQLCSFFTMLLVREHNTVTLVRVTPYVYRRIAERISKALVSIEKYNAIYC